MTTARVWLGVLAFVLATPGESETPPFRSAIAALPAPEETRPFWLSETGLYADIARKQLASGTLEYRPTYELWSDGAHKRRWLQLPPGTRIDTSDMDHWQFPVGTRLWKEFSRDGRRIETRLIVRTGSRSGDYWMGAFVWNEAESDARFTPAGVRDARGTPHDVPSDTACFTCHNGEPGRVLGFSAVQRGFSPPGDPAAAAALGYLHANCGHCHNPNGSARPDTDLTLRLSVTDRRIEDTGAYRTAVGQPMRSYRDSHRPVRIVPGSAADSGLWRRMLDRTRAGRMPPLGSEEPDSAGAERVRAFIDAL